MNTSYTESNYITIYLFFFETNVIFALTSYNTTVTPTLLAQLHLINIKLCIMSCCTTNTDDDIIHT